MWSPNASGERYLWFLLTGKFLQMEKKDDLNDKTYNYYLKTKYGRSHMLKNIKTLEINLH